MKCSLPVCSIKSIFKFCIVPIVVLCITVNAHARSNSYSSEHNSYFIENKGQITDQNHTARTDINYRYNTNGGPDIFIGAGTIHYQFCKMEESASWEGVVGKVDTRSAPPLEHAHNETIKYTIYRMDVELIGANKNARLIPSGQEVYYEVYYSNGMNGVVAKAFSKVIYQEIYPGIDWVIYTHDNQLKHEFIVHANGKVSDIQIKYKGATHLILNSDGTLTAETPMGSIAEQAPVAWQQDGKKVDSRFVANGNIVTYAIGQYAGQLVIDPALSWATYYGGSQIDYANSVTTDLSGNAYLAGCTYSTESIATTGAHQQTFSSAPGSPDCFVAKFNSSGTRLWATYYGGSSTDHGIDIAVDKTGNAVYLCGIAMSDDGIATTGAHKSSKIAFMENGFLVKFNSDGIRQWGTYVGGDYPSKAYSVVTDGGGNVYISGETDDTGGIATPGAHQSASGGGQDGFLVKFNSLGVRQWGTYYGGTGMESVYSLAVDASDNIYASGYTTSTGGIASIGAHQPIHGGTVTEYEDCFLVKFNSSGTRLWGTYYGGTGGDYGSGIATDGVGNIFVSGHTKSPNGIATAGSHKSVPGLNFECFLAKFNGSGVRIWGTYFGSTGDDFGVAVAANEYSVFMAGYTSSAAGLSTVGAHSNTCSGMSDGYFAQFSPSGVLLYSSYFGGLGDDNLYSVACDNSGNLYLAGLTTSSTDIVTPGAHDETYGGTSVSGLKDAILIKFGGFPLSVAQYDNRRAAISVYPNPTSGDVTFDVTEAGEISISSIDGKVISRSALKEGKNVIQLSSSVKPGFYFCSFVSQSGESEVLKLIHQK